MRLVTLFVILGAGVLPVSAQTSKQDVDASKISKLIEQLGTDQFRARERAQRMLESIGVRAFDALHDAQYHDDIEIAARAKYLIQSMQVDWTDKGDTAEARRILKLYAASDAGDRQNRIARLAKLEDKAGVRPLCRIVRYEANGQLSRVAALEVLKLVKQDDWSKADSELASIIQIQLGPSRRAGSNWLKTVAKSFGDLNGQIAKWEELAREEEIELDKKRGRTNRKIVRNLLRWQAEVFTQVGRDDRAQAAIKRTIRLLDGTQLELVEMIDWLIERKAWKEVDDLHDNFKSKFDGNSVLLYRLAEAKLAAGDEDRANQLAQAALGVDKDDLTAHLNAAQALRDRGQMAWSKNEFQHVIRITKPGTIVNLYARILISEIHHDFDEDLQAAESLKSVVEMAKRPEIAQILTDRLQKDLPGLKARMNYFYATHYGKNDINKARAQLLEGVKKDPNDPDILISLYRIPTPDVKMAESTKKRIKSTVSYYQNQRKQYQKAIKNANDVAAKSRAKGQLAHADNQLAWLISNTFGDYKEAIKLSHESLELRPNTSAYLDTLGRCYFADKDYDNAIKYQKKAVAMEPHSAQMKRQLKLFEDAKRQQSEDAKLQKTKDQ